MSTYEAEVFLTEFVSHIQTFVLGISALRMKDGLQ